MNNVKYLEAHLCSLLKDIENCYVFYMILFHPHNTFCKITAIQNTRANH